MPAPKNYTEDECGRSTAGDDFPVVRENGRPVRSPNSKNAEINPLTQALKHDKRLMEGIMNGTLLAPNIIKVGDTIKLLHVDVWAARYGTTTRAVRIIHERLGIPPVFLRDEEYYNELSVELVFHGISRPSAPGFIGPGCPHAKSRALKKRKHTGVPLSFITDELKEHLSSPDLYVEMICARTLYTQPSVHDCSKVVTPLGFKQMVAIVRETVRSELGLYGKDDPVRELEGI